MSTRRPEPPKRRPDAPKSGEIRRKVPPAARPLRTSTQNRTTSGQSRTTPTGQNRTTTGESRTARPASAAAPRRKSTRPPAKGKRSATSRTRQPERPLWQRALQKAVRWTLATGLVVGAVAFIAGAITYASLSIPAADDFAQAQATTIYYADGVTVMGRMGVANRQSVRIEDLPPHVYNAVVAAEDRSFYSNPGIDFVGTTRAMFNTVVLGKKQGGSSITQQYVERYYSGETVTDVPGKIEEALMALKIDQQQDKLTVLENYMNTIYFGRGAYGIEAAAREYYGKHAADLTVSESAMIAGIIPRPSGWDPRIDPDMAELRWNYVLDGMVDGGFLTPAERLKQTFPDVIEYANEDTFGGPTGYILRAALDEVAQRTDITADEIEVRGYSIITTIDVPTQRAAEAAALTLPDGHSPNLRMAIVTLNPQTGAITAMYGGADYLTVQRNAVTQDVAQAGSTFKPFALVAALERGISLDSIYDGNNGAKVEGFTGGVRNFGAASYGPITLTDATVRSVNTVYAQLGVDVGPANVRETAVRAGLPAETLGLEDNPANVLGTASPHPLDMASAYGTFANGGVATEPFLITSVSSLDGAVFYEHADTAHRVFDTDVMADTVYAMTQVVQRGSGTAAGGLGRPVAGKTGTSSANRSAWFVGYTPNIVGAVALYQVGEDGSAQEITPFGGRNQITGGSFPARIWAAMMTDVFASLPVEQFPPRAYVGEVRNAPEPSPSPTPSPSPSPSATLPEPVVTPQPNPTPSGGVGDVVDGVLP